MSVCCVRCKSVSKLPIFCNSCYQESFKSGERRGRVEELKRIKDLLKVSVDEAINGEDIAIDVYFEQLKDYIEKRLLELK